jgi:hypothetical protein
MQDYTGPLFPADNAWRASVDNLPVHPRSDAFISSLGASTGLHPDFGTYYNGQPIGFSYNIVGAGAPKPAITFEYADESDPGPYPIPANPLLEGLNTWTETVDGDRHLLVIDTNTNRLYETWYTWPPGIGMPSPGDWSTYPPASPASWWAGSGAVFDLSADTLRPAGWTSADAAGLPVFPGLIRYDEVAGGEITHAIRFTAQHTQNAYVWPARHSASSITNPNVPALGQRFRLKAAVDISGYSARNQVILRAFKKYGLILADNGSNWYFSGTHDDRWSDDELNQLKNLRGSNFEAVDISGWLNNPAFNPNSAAVPGTSPGNGNPSGGATLTPVPKDSDWIIVFPNPARLGDPIIRASLGQATAIKINICNAAGQAVHSGNFSNQPAGYTPSGQPYYDYKWKGGKAPGVYFALIQAKRGLESIRGQIKFAVMKP